MYTITAGLDRFSCTTRFRTVFWNCDNPKLEDSLNHETDEGRDRALKKNIKDIPVTGREGP
jgi:hypothetical protein